MKKIFTHITILFTVLFVFSTTVTCATGDEPVLTPEYRLLQLINAARSNPLGMAQRYGMNPSELIAVLPELNDILINGLPPLVTHDAVITAAELHAADLIENDHYSVISTDGRTLKERLKEVGYISLHESESLGMITFYNYIGSITAADFIFRNMFLDELRPDREEARNILSAEMTDIGISFSAGSFVLSGRKLNGYIAVCDFAVEPNVSPYEYQLLDLINQAREYPLETFESLGIDVGQLLIDCPELETLFNEGMAPLSLSAEIFQAAEKHLEDMLKTGYYSVFSEDGRTVTDRLAEYGISGVAADEIIQVFSSIDYLEPDDAAKIIFELMLREELASDCDNHIILNPNMTEVGIKLQVPTIDEGVLNEATGTIYYTTTLVADFAGEIDVPIEVTAEPQETF